MPTIKSPIDGRVVTDSTYFNVKSADGTKYVRIPRNNVTPLTTDSTISVNEPWIDGEEKNLEYWVYDKNNWSKVNKNQFLSFKPKTGQGTEQKTGEKSVIPQYSQLSSVPGLQDLVGFTTPQVGLGRIATGQAESVSITDNILSEELKKMKKLMNL